MNAKKTKQTTENKNFNHTFLVPATHCSCTSVRSPAFKPAWYAAASIPALELGKMRIFLKKNKWKLKHTHTHTHTRERERERERETTLPAQHICKLFTCGSLVCVHDSADVLKEGGEQGKKKKRFENPYILKKKKWWETFIVKRIFIHILDKVDQIAKRVAIFSDAVFHYNWNKVNVCKNC